jgi:hypothetical protein
MAAGSCRLGLERFVTHGSLELWSMAGVVMPAGIMVGILAFL